LWSSSDHVWKEPYITYDYIKYHTRNSVLWPFITTDVISRQGWDISLTQTFNKQVVKQLTF